MVTFKADRKAKRQIHAIKGISKFNTACTEINGCGTVIVGWWMSLVRMAMHVEIEEIGFFENVCDALGALLLGVLICINTYQYCFLLVLPFVNGFDEIVNELCLRVWMAVTFLME